MNLSAALSSLGITQTTGLSALRSLPFHSSAQSVYLLQRNDDVSASDHYRSAIFRGSLLAAAVNAFERRAFNPVDSTESDQ